MSLQRIRRLFYHEEKTLLALIIGGRLILTACGESAAVSEAVENASEQQNIEDSSEQETSEAETSASSESKHFGKKSEHSSDLILRNK